MEESSAKPPSQSYSLFFAFLAFLGAALLLLPIVWLIFDKYFKLYFFGAPPDAWKNDLIVAITFFLWLILSCGAGGYVQALKSKTKPYIFAWFPLVVGLIGMLLLETNIGRSEFLILLGIIGLGVGGSLLGSWMGKRRKERALAQ